jgi:hypothetical protein
MKTTKLQKNILKTFEIYVMILKDFVNGTWQLIQVNIPVPIIIT